jgi:hypothetical protein
MAQQLINVGTTANDGTGDLLRNGFIKVNQNFTELYTNRISGSGTDNYIPRFNGTNALENSIIFDNGTNVGIGTTSPVYPLQVNGVINTNSFFRIGDATTIGGIGSANAIFGVGGNDWVFYNPNATSNVFYTSGTERMRITSSGNVGIGTSDFFENAKLTLQGGLVVRSGAISNAPSQNAVVLDNAGGISRLMASGASTWNAVLAINPFGGNVGIGTTNPTEKLHVAGVAQILDDGSRGRITFQISSTQNDLYSTTTAFDDYRNLRLSSNELILSSGGTTERMRITSSGNVGIGTTTADYRTQIETTSANVFLVKNTSSTSFNRSYFYNNNNIGTQFLNFGSAYGFGTEFGVGQNGSVLQSNTTSAFAIGTSTSTPLYLGTNGTERMRITSAGKVGIGATNPYSKLEIVGPSTSYSNSPSIVLTDNAGTINSRRWLIGNVATDYGSLNFAVSTTNSNDPVNSKMTIKKEGNVGIGTTSPAYPLEVNGSINVYPNNFFRYDGDTGIIGSATSIGGASNQLGIRASNDILFATNGANERMRITSGGNVGIGTSSPSEKLTLSGGALRLESATGVSSYVHYISPGNDEWSAGMNGAYDFQIAYSNGLGTPRMTLLKGGNVGIGTTSPTSKLQVVGLPSYVDNTTALAGGLTAGAFYHTAGVLKVVI